MTRRDDAIKAAAREIDPGAWTGSTAVKGARRAFALEQATVILDAALAVLQPTAEQTLHNLPIGAVIRADGAAYVHTDAWEWVETVTGTAWTADELAAHRHNCWHVIHTPEEPA